MVYSIMNDEPVPLQHYIPEAPAELLHILDRALEKDREERYQTVHEMLIDLRRLKKDSARMSLQPHYGTSAPGTGVPVPAEEGKKGLSKRLWVRVAGLLFLCAVPVAYFLLRVPATRLDPNRTTVTLKIPFREMWYPSLSRDGNWVVFPARDEGGKWDIFWMNVAAGKPTRVTDELVYSIYYCDISPDLSQIVFECSDKPKGCTKVRITASQGGESRTLVDTGVVPKWNRDGGRIGYMRVGSAPRSEFPSASGKLEIWSIRPDGTDNRLELIDTATTQDPTAFCWSPDGGSITWVRNYPEGYGEVMVRELSTGKERQLTFDRKKVDEAIWAANDEILFVSNKSGQSNLWTIPAWGGQATQVTQGGVPVGGAKISDDSRRLVYMQMENIAHIWISSIDGTNPHQVMSDDTRALTASFSPDGKHLALISRDVDEFNEEAHLYVMDRDGKNQRQLSSGSEIVTASRWSPDGKWLAYSSRAIGEPGDSDRVYLIQPLKPGSPRMLCKGYCWWIDDANLVVFDQMKTSRYSIKGGTSTRVYQDSTFAVPLNAYGQLVFFDFREGRDSWWVVAVDSAGRQEGRARRICPPDAMDISSSHDSALLCVPERR